MLNRLLAFLAPPKFEDDLEKTRRASMLNVVLLFTLGVIGTTGIAAPLIFEDLLVAAIVLGSFFAAIIISRLLMHRGRVTQSAFLYILLNWGIATAGAYFMGGLTGSPFIFSYFAVVTLAGVLISGWAALGFTALSIVTGLLLTISENLGSLPPAFAFVPSDILTGLIANLFIAMILLFISSLSINRAFDDLRYTEYQTLEANRELLEMQTELETRIAERTQALERRASQLQAAAEVGRAAAQIYNLDELLSRITHLISENFGFYQVGIFMLDERNEYAVLRAANSEGGLRMLTRGHRLQVGQQGLVGFATSAGQARIALDVGADAVHFNTPELPNTRSEMALPLVAGGRILGALDVQSVEESAFSPEDIETLQVLADQVAMAISNARFFQETQERLAAERRAYGEISQAAWQAILHTGSRQGYICDAQGDVKPTDERWGAEMIQAGREGGMVKADGGQTIAIPVRVRNVVAGVVRFHKSPHAGNWNPDEISMMESLTDQMALALENARLYETSQRRALREQVTGTVVTRMRETLNVDTILRTAVQEFSQALGAPEVVIRLNEQNAPTPVPDGQPGQPEEK